MIFLDWPAADFHMLRALVMLVPWSRPPQLVSQFRCFPNKDFWCGLSQDLDAYLQCTQDKLKIGCFNFSFTLECIQGSEIWNIFS